MSFSILIYKYKEMIKKLFIAINIVLVAIVSVASAKDSCYSNCQSDAELCLFKGNSVGKCKLRKYNCYDKCSDLDLKNEREMDKSYLNDQEFQTVDETFKCPKCVKHFTLCRKANTWETCYQRMK